MKKDIFIDNNIAKNFSNPLDVEYQKLIRWLMFYDPINKNKNAFLAVSNKLLIEYYSSSGYSQSNTSIVVLISQLKKENRLNKITNEEIKNFKRLHYKKKIVKNLTCNQKDREHIPVVLLSDRKYALSLDNKFINDLSIKYRKTHPRQDDTRKVRN